MRQSYWLENYKKTPIPNKRLAKETDILIIGGGMTGISTAYQLKDTGKRITLVEAKELGHGVTGFTTAKVSVLHDTLLSSIYKYHGLKKAMLYLESQIEAANLIEEIIIKEKINCDYKKEDAYLYATTNKELNKLNKEYNLLKRLGAGIELVDDIELPIKIKKAIKYKNNASFHPLKYLNGIVKILLKSGVSIHENSRVMDIDDNGTYFNTEFENGDIIKSEIVIVATHYPIMKVMGLYFSKLVQERSYAVAFETKKVIPGMYINICDPIRSYRNINNKTMILGGGSHFAGDEIDIDYYNELRDAIKNYDNNAKIINEWSTEDCMPVDYIPFIGQYSWLSPKVYVATGFQKWGMTNSHVAALSISRDILNLDNPYHKLYNPTRCSHIRSFGNFLGFMGKIIVGMVLSRLVIPKDAKANIKIGSGDVIRTEGKTVAVYRKSYNKYLSFKPHCTHLGCNITWNDIDKTWDCKCHGSRFNPDGSVLNEPANKPLETSTK